jgi:hypothetical protein
MELVFKIDAAGNFFSVPDLEMSREAGVEIVAVDEFKFDYPEGLIRGCASAIMKRPVDAIVNFNRKQAIVAMIYERPLSAQMQISNLITSLASESAVDITSFKEQAVKKTFALEEMKAIAGESDSGFPEDFMAGYEATVAKFVECLDLVFLFFRNPDGLAGDYFKDLARKIYTPEKLTNNGARLTEEQQRQLAVKVIMARRCEEFAEVSAARSTKLSSQFGREAQEKAEQARKARREAEERSARLEAEILIEREKLRRLEGSEAQRKEAARQSLTLVLDSGVTIGIEPPSTSPRTSGKDEVAALAKAGVNAKKRQREE